MSDEARHCREVAEELSRRGFAPNEWTASRLAIAVADLIARERAAAKEEAMKHIAAVAQFIPTCPHACGVCNLCVFHAGGSGG